MSLWETMRHVMTERLALTFVHFAWQGLAVLVVFLLLNGLLALRSPSRRYGLTLLAFCCMAVCPLATFCYLSQYPVAESAQIAASNPPTIANAVGQMAQAVLDTDQPHRVVVSNSANGTLATTRNQEPLQQSWRQAIELCIVLGWMVGVGLLGTRLLFGWIWLQQLKRVIEPVAESVMRKAEELCKALGLRTPHIAVSRSIPEAVATGLFRPIILIPASWLTELPPAMLEAVLAHELAHLRRWDLLVNLFQRITEILLFYHPAVWWLSRRLRIEREFCCDEIAVELTGDRLGYAQTLEQVGRLALRESSAGMALAIGGSRMNLFARVKRVLEPKPAQPSRLTWLAGVTVLAVALLVGWSILLAPSQGVVTAGVEQASQPSGEKHLSITVVDQDNRPVPGVSVGVYKSGKRTQQEFRTDAEGKFKVPDSWRDPEDQHYATFVVELKGQVGWLSCSEVLAGKSEGASFQVVLLPISRSIKGQLADNEGKPLAGIRIECEGLYHEVNRWVWGASVDIDALNPLIVTDQQGSFSLKIPAGSACHLRPRHPDWLAVRIGTKKEQDDIGQIRLDAAGRIEGLVVDASNKPIAGAAIGAQAYKRGSKTGGWGDAKTDAEGHFVLGGLEPGQYNVLFSGVSGQPTLVAPAAEGVAVMVGQAAKADFRVTEGKLLAGTVIEADTGKPLAKCAVGCYSAGNPRSGPAARMVHTDEKGSFHFYVPTGVAHVYIASGDRTLHPDSSRTIEVLENTAPTSLMLKAGSLQKSRAFAGDKAMSAADQKKILEDASSYRQEVILRTSDGRPVTKVVLHGQWWTSYGAGNSASATFHSRNDGDTAFFMIDATGFAMTRTPVFVIRKTMEPLIIDLEPAVYVPIRGRVVDLQGKPVIGARVRTGRFIFRTEEYPWGVETTTDNDGCFKLMQIRLGERISVHVEMQGTAGAITDLITVTNSDPIDLPEFKIGPPDKTIKGIVLDEDKKPVPGAKVVYRGENVVETMSDEQGHFEIKGLPDGKFPIIVTAPGLSYSWPPIRAGEVDVTIRMRSTPPAAEHTYHIDVKLQPKDGKTLPLSRLWLVNLKKQEEYVSYETRGNDRKIELRASLFDNRADGLAILAAVDGYALPPPVPISDFKNTNSVIIELEPAPTVKVQGRILGEDGKPLAGAMVKLSRALIGNATDSNISFWKRFPLATTDANGNYDIAGVIPGSQVSVYANKVGFAGVSSARTPVEKSKDAKLPDLVLKKSARQITGRVVNAKNQPVAGARVFIRDVVPLEAITDVDGRFRLDGIPVAAELTLIVDSLDYDIGRQPLTTDAKELTITLVRD